MTDPKKLQEAIRLLESEDWHGPAGRLLTGASSPAEVAASLRDYLRHRALTPVEIKALAILDGLSGFCACERKVVVDLPGQPPRCFNCRRKIAVSEPPNPEGETRDLEWVANARAKGMTEGEKGHTPLYNRPSESPIANAYREGYRIGRIRRYAEEARLLYADHRLGAYLDLLADALNAGLDPRTAVANLSDWPGVDDSDPPRIAVEVLQILKGEA